MNNEIIASNKISIPGCTLNKNGASFEKAITFDQWQSIGQTIQYLGKGVMFWLGDWINFGETNFSEKYAQALDATDYDYDTLAHAAWVTKHVDIWRRRQKLSFAHHREVVPLSKKEQEKWLDKAEKEKLTSKDLRRLIQQEKHAKILENNPVIPIGKYSVIYADPPWDVKAGPGWGSSGESRDLIYPTMSLDEIKNLPVKDLAHEDAHLYLWTINKYIQETYDVARAWGFEPSCLITWVKSPHGIGLGGTFIQTTEHLLFCRKGALEAIKRIDTTWFHFNRGKHSEKPDEFRKMIEEVSPGKKIELFARTKSEGWTVWGNQI